MDIFKEKYKDKKGKTDSMYVYVFYKCTQKKIHEHVNEQLKIISRVRDEHKRKLFSSRYFLIKELIDQNLDEHMYDCVMFVGDDIYTHQLTNANKELLRKFDHRNITFVYDNHFKLDFIEDLLFNDKPYHIYKVNNNHVDYIHITKTKKVIVNSKESKPLDIQEFITYTIPSNTRYIVYGNSAKFKDLNDPKAYAVINKLVKDDELIEMTERIDQEDVLTALSLDLSMMCDHKQMHKVIFKKDISEKIKNSQLEKLYINSKMQEKFLENMKKQKLDINFKLIVIDTSLKSFVEGREKIIDTYAGVVGIVYY